MKHTIEIKIFSNYIHYYLNNKYIGMLVLDKGELSDFRAIIRKNKLNINSKNIYEVIKTALYGLLNHYLSEYMFLNKDEADALKVKIVKNNDTIIQNAAIKIKENFIFIGQK